MGSKTNQKTMKMINLACGNNYHKDWINVDFNPSNSYIKKCNLLSELPFPTNSFDVAYCSHFLEHLNYNDSKKFLKEVRRILKSGAIFRIVIPNLENICREYIRILDNPQERNSFKRQWIYNELMDQMVRTVSGGNMKEIYERIKNNKDFEYANYIRYRVGENLFQEDSAHKFSKLKSSLIYRLYRLTFDKFKVILLYLYLNLVKLLIPNAIRNEVFVETSIGERHKWMYDKFSITELLEECGFKNIEIVNYNASRIPNFNDFLLDINNDGTPRKGYSSLYVECEK